MRETNHQHEISGEGLDRLLDAALAKYADANPRTGLEERILASLQSEQANEATASWWKWGLVAALAAVAVLAIAVSLRFGKAGHPVIANHPTLSMPDSLRVPVIPDVQPRDRESTAHIRQVRRSVRHLPAPATVVTDGPKLDQFPSPQPLSEEERALVQYVRSFPKDAKVIAQAQEEFDLEAQRQMNDGALQSPASDSIQQER